MKRKSKHFWENGTLECKLTALELWTIMHGEYVEFDFGALRPYYEVAL